MHGRPTCSECSDKLRSKRGCFKPGFAVEGSSALFRFTSPLLHEFGDDSATLRECPTGRVLREAPWVFDVINAYNQENNSGIDLLRLPRRIQRLFAIASSEQARLRQIEEQRRKAKRDAEYGRNALKR